MILTPRNWTDFQHYKTRSPPWIRLHKRLLDNFDFQRLPLASKALAPMLWLLASESANTEAPEIDGRIEQLAFRLRITEAEVIEGLKPLIEKQFFVVASGVLAECLQPAAKSLSETEADSSEAETKADQSSLRSDSSSPTADDPKPADSKAAKLAERVAQVTLDAIEAFNAKHGKPNGCMPSVSLKVGMDKKRKFVSRCLKVAGDICAEANAGNRTVTPRFWDGYFATVDKDEFKSGRNTGSSWLPSFEYLTRPDVMLAVFENSDRMSPG